MANTYDAIVVVSFGGPEGRDDVIPFLENVLRGRNVPRERMLAVAEHYYHFDGISPINAQNRALIEAIRTELQTYGPALPVYFGNRNWHPLLPDTLQQMAKDGVNRALGFFTSAFSSYSGCRQYRENVEAAQVLVGPNAPVIDKLRSFFNHPGFIEPMVENLKASLEKVPTERRDQAFVLFSAHSIPRTMADNCQYEPQFREASRLVAEGAGVKNWQVVYQSRSGPPTQPWLEPDISDAIKQLHAEQHVRDVVSVPIGFVSDHMEVLYDLDIEAKHLCDELGIHFVRCSTVGCHPRFVQMIRELIVERCSDTPERLALGSLGPNHDVCPVDCCRYEARRPVSSDNKQGGQS